MIKKEWSKVVVQFSIPQKEIVNAFLLELKPDSILENELNFEVFFESEITDELLESIQNIPGVVGHLESSKCINKNWNEVWESNYEPIEIDDYCQIRAEFHPPNPKVPYQIIIRPQMAFGTGHHETTYMMIEEINGLNLLGKSVWDYGCGTAILSVFSWMKGASSIMCNDIESWAVENAELHFDLNKVPAQVFTVIEGAIDSIPIEQKHDVILANINRKVLLDSMLGIRSRLKDGGFLLMSGILDVDKDLVVQEYLNEFELINQRQKGEWICMKMQPKIS